MRKRVITQILPLSFQRRLESRWGKGETKKSSCINAEKRNCANESPCAVILTLNGVKGKNLVVGRRKYVTDQLRK